MGLPIEPGMEESALGIGNRLTLRDDQPAEAIGEATVGVIRAQADRRTHRDETVRSSLGILRLAKDFSSEQLEAACHRALTLKRLSYRAIATLI